ncbi:POLG alternative reading frame-like [Elephas maximus indicus]|uniref:POLG alternative reading frame-like n=1 Tax=Elephas maximus indicus TaxID=99487 RepID=UPI002116960E|nr:POLG alternative reading frame-like [Elephas maximus indicus]
MTLSAYDFSNSRKLRMRTNRAQSSQSNVCASAGARGRRFGQGRPRLALALAGSLEKEQRGRKTLLTKNVSAVSQTLRPRPAPGGRPSPRASPLEGAGAGARAEPTQVLRIRLGGGYAGLYKPPGVRSCVRLAAKIVPTCLRAPRRACSPAGRPARPAGPRRPHGVPAGKSCLPPAWAGLGGAAVPAAAANGPRAASAGATVPPPPPVRASPGRGVGHVPAGVGPRGGGCVTGADRTEGAPGPEHFFLLRPSHVRPEAAGACSLGA